MLGKQITGVLLKGESVIEIGSAGKQKEMRHEDQKS
jgi:hypothetical protein